MDQRIIQEARRYAASCRTEEVELLRRLASIPSPTRHEGLRARFVRDWFVRQGADPESVRIDEAGNVVLHIADDGVSDLAVFAAHTDVVFPDTQPIPVTEHDGRMEAPGVGDDTANLVGLMLATRLMLRHRDHLRRGVLVVADTCEEGLGNLRGTKELFQRYASRVHTFVSFDLYLGECVVHAVGSHRWKLRVTTQGGHSWEDFGRANALEVACRIVEGLYALPRPDDARTSVNVGRMEGGTTVNAIAAAAEVVLEYRSTSDEALAQMRSGLEALIDSCRSDEVAIELELLGVRPASGDVDGSLEGRLVAAADEAISAVAGEKVRHTASSTDANVPLSLGIPAITVGAVAGGLLHTRDEWVDESSLPRGLAMTYALMAHLSGLHAEQDADVAKTDAPEAEGNKDVA